MPCFVGRRSFRALYTLFAEPVKRYGLYELINVCIHFLF